MTVILPIKSNTKSDQNQGIGKSKDDVELFSLLYNDFGVIKWLRSLEQ